MKNYNHMTKIILVIAALIGLGVIACQYRDRFNFSYVKKDTVVTQGLPLQLGEHYQSKHL